VSSHLAEITLCKLAELMVPNNFSLLLSRIKDDLISKALEVHSMFAFLSGAFVNAIIPKLTELKIKEKTPPHFCALKACPQGHPFKHCLLPCVKDLRKKINIKFRVLYKPEAKNFPLVGVFFFMESNPMTLVGLRMTTGDEHHTITSTMRQFTECLAAYFSEWKELSQKILWDIIYKQHTDSRPIKKWQKCDVDNIDNINDEEIKIEALWNGKVRQYQVSISYGVFRRDETHRTEE
ncbi:retrotransposon hot spot (RHS) protein, putative, partial [Trypanosoma cruzi marinkellei]